MFAKLEQFVPSAVCLSCDGCCRFKEADSRWRPKVGVEEQTALRKIPLAQKVLTKQPLDGEGFLPTLKCHDMYLCAFFNPQDHTCGVYQQRPFECQLYPFIITKAPNGRPGVYVHLNCPYVQEYRLKETFAQYASYLQNYFRQQAVLDFLQNNPSAIGDYTSYENELEYLFSIELK